MTLDDLRRAAELLPPGSSVLVPREALLGALEGVGTPNGHPLQVDASVESKPEPAEAGQWLTADDVAAMLATSTRWVYDHQRQLGAKRLSRRCVRFSPRVVAQYMARRS